MLSLWLPLLHGQYQRLTLALTGSAVLCCAVLGGLHEGQVGAVGYLRGDAGAPVHGLLTVAP